MKTLFKALGEVISYPEENSPPLRNLITIGGDVFAVARSRQEMARMLRMPDPKVTGYILQHRM